MQSNQSPAINLYEASWIVKLLQIKRDYIIDNFGGGMFGLLFPQQLCLNGKWTCISRVVLQSAVTFTHSNKHSYTDCSDCTPHREQFDIQCLAVRTFRHAVRGAGVLNQQPSDHCTTHLATATPILPHFYSWG